MTRFLDLPQDVSQLIVTTAVIIDRSRSTGRVMSCVSRDIQFWADPLLFRTLEFNNRKDYKDYLSLQSTSQSSRLARIRPVVWAFAFQKPINLEELRDLLSLHPSIKFLLFEEITPGAETLHIPTLTQLVTMSGSQVQLLGPLFANVTHLNLLTLRAKDIPTFANNLAQMASLQAILFAAGEDGFQPQVVQAALDALPSTLGVIIFGVMVDSMNQFWHLSAITADLATGELDPRVVVAIWCYWYHNVPPGFINMENEQINLWDIYGSDENTVWSEATAIQTQRKAAAEQRSSTT
ncbi:hypothetical protein DL96DRAFT_1717068 [Flagelloscypha sp. PMI_526]|nr:hypothetical protein DL96DRAFT_1717068 [Flagelloscypha sp. PMI_526]